VRASATVTLVWARADVKWEDGSRAVPQAKALCVMVFTTEGLHFVRVKLANIVAKIGSRHGFDVRQRPNSGRSTIVVARRGATARTKPGRGRSSASFV